MHSRPQHTWIHFFLENRKLGMVPKVWVTLKEGLGCVWTSKKWDRRSSSREAETCGHFREQRAHAFSQVRHQRGIKLKKLDHIPENLRNLCKGCGLFFKTVICIRRFEGRQLCDQMCFQKLNQAMQCRIDLKGLGYTIREKVSLGVICVNVIIEDTDWH